MLFQNPILIKPDRLRESIEEALQKSLTEPLDYQDPTEESPIVTIADPKGIIHFANDNFWKILKYSWDELIGSIANPGYHQNHHHHVCQPY